MEKYSYSKLETFEQCPFKYKTKYIDRNRSEESTLALEIGTLAHKGKELWGEHLVKKEEPDYDFIINIINNGIECYDIVLFNGKEIKNKKTEDILGIRDLKSKYFESYFEKDNKTGMTYDEKLIPFISELGNHCLENEWTVLNVEREFTFTYKDKCFLNGFIDRVDINPRGEIRVVDYKTSKAVYDSKKLTTPLQMFIYTLASEHLYKKQPTEHIYEFIFLGEKQKACSPGYYNRGIKKLDKLLDSIDACCISGEYIPKPTPLCYWCEYAKHTPLSDKKLNHLCPYYSLWTPNNKTFEVNKKYDKSLTTSVSNFWF